MVAVSLAPIAGLMMVAARITDPALSPAVFNAWYSDVHVRDMVTNNFASIALRYTNATAGSLSVTPSLTPASQYLALYNVPDVNFISAPGTMNKLPLNHDSLPDKTKPVMTWSSWTFTYWLPVQTFEGKSTATERSKYVLVVKVEPAKGADEDFDQWYRKEVCNLRILVHSTLTRSSIWICWLRYQDIVAQRGISPQMAPGQDSLLCMSSTI
jgi:hypothetical protein